MKLVRHKTIEKILDPKTRIVTAKVSYIYTCPICGKSNRCAYPDYRQTVTCDGLDFTVETRLDLENSTHLRNVKLNLNEEELEMLETVCIVGTIEIDYSQAIKEEGWIQSEDWIQREDEIIKIIDIAWSLEEIGLLKYIETPYDRWEDEDWMVFRITELGRKVLAWQL